jgi:hypothetical protein
MMINTTKPAPPNKQQTNKQARNEASERQRKKERKKAKKENENEPSPTRCQILDKSKNPRIKSLGGSDGGEEQDA